MKKTIVLLLLALAMILSACGGNAGTGESSSTAESKTAATESKTPEESGTAAGEADPTASLSAQVELKNLASYTIDDMVDAETNGFLAAEIKALIRIISVTKAYGDVYTSFELDTMDDHEDAVDYYGENYRAYIEFGDRAEVAAAELSMYSEGFAEIGNEFLALFNKFDALSAEAKQEIAGREETGISAEKLGELFGTLKTAGEKLVSAEITEGAKYSFVIYLNTAEADSVEADSGEVAVIVIDGIWLQPASLRKLLKNVYSMVEDIYVED
ncbi:MAG: hypothetical protein J5793_05480 [Clostridia bacterium]|nr:hypothetical protein [Clostridia bacterium]